MGSLHVFFLFFKPFPRYEVVYELHDLSLSSFELLESSLLFVNLFEIRLLLRYGNVLLQFDMRFSSLFFLRYLAPSNSSSSNFFFLLTLSRRWSFFFFSFHNSIWSRAFLRWSFGYQDTESTWQPFHFTQ